MKKLSALFLCLILVLSAIPVCAESTTQISIIYTSDYRGDFDLSSDEARSPFDSAYLAALKASQGSSLLIDCGNSLYGSPFSALSSGSFATELMADAGYDCAVLGANDLCFGADGITALAKNSSFRLISAPLQSIDGIYEDILTDINGIKVGVIGLTGLDGNLAGKFGASELIEATVEVTAGLKAAGANVIIAAGSLGSTSAEDIFSQISGIDIALITDIEDETVIGETRVFPVSSAFSGVGTATVTLEDGNISAASVEIITKDDSASLTFDELGTAAKQTFEAARLNQSGNYSEALSSKLSDNKDGIPLSSDDLFSSNDLGYLAAESIRNYCGTDFALFRASRIKSSLDTTLITYRNLTDAIPGFERLVKTSVTPSVLYDIMENSVSDIEQSGESYTDKGDKFYEISGFKVVYDPDANRGERIVSLTTDDGQKLDRNDEKTEYSLAATELCELADCEKTIDGRTDFDALTKFISKSELTGEFFRTENFERIRMEKEARKDRGTDIIIAVVCALVILLALAVIFLKIRKNRTEA